MIKTIDRIRKHAEECGYEYPESAWTLIQMLADQNDNLTRECYYLGVNNQYMLDKIERDRVAGELAALENLLASMPDSDVITRVGFEARRGELKELLGMVAENGR